MAADVVINNKVYVPSTELSVEFDYTHDYLSKLAREEKVLATQIKRKWYIEPGSLRVFLMKTEAAKKYHNERIRAERRLEQLIITTKTPDNPSVPQFALQAISVILCGILVGFLGFYSAEEGVTADDFIQGGTSVASTLLGFSTIDGAAVAAAPGAVFAIAEQLVIRASVLGAVEEGGRAPDTFAYLEPELPSGEFTAFPNIDDVEEIVFSPEAYFSDEVLLQRWETDGVEVQPIFKNTEGSLYTIVVEDVQVGELVE